nr:hypothetical protein [Mycobacterium attenuatum]
MVGVEGEGGGGAQVGAAAGGQPAAAVGGAAPASARVGAEFAGEYSVALRFCACGAGVEEQAAVVQAGDAVARPPSQLPAAAVVGQTVWAEARVAGPPARELHAQGQHPRCSGIVGEGHGGDLPDRHPGGGADPFGGLREQPHDVAAVGGRSGGSVQPDGRQDLAVGRL